MTSRIDWRKLFGSLSGLVAALSAFFAVRFAMEAFSGGDGITQPGIYAGLVVFFSGAALASGYVARLLGRSPTVRPAPIVQHPPAPPPEPPEAQRRRRVIELAQRERGRVTVLEVAARCNLTADEAKSALDELVIEKVAVMQVSESGILVYALPAFLPAPRKRRRRRR